MIKRGDYVKVIYTDMYLPPNLAMHGGVSILGVITGMPPDRDLTDGELYVRSVANQGWVASEDAKVTKLSEKEYFLEALKYPNGVILL